MTDNSIEIVPLILWLFFLKKEKFEAKIDNTTLVRDYDQIVSNEREVVLDARPDQIYESGHIPNAINVPYNELFDRKTGLLKTKEDLLTCKLKNDGRGI